MNVESVYQRIMEQLGAEPAYKYDGYGEPGKKYRFDEEILADRSTKYNGLNPVGSEVIEYKIPEGTALPEDGYLRELRNQWFDAGGSMKISDSHGVDAFSGEKPRTRKIPVGEKFKRELMFNQEHFLPVSGPGSRPLSKIPTNIGRGPKVANATMGGAHSFPGLLDSADNAAGRGAKNIAGSVDLGNRGSVGKLFNTLRGLAEAGVISPSEVQEIMKSELGDSVRGGYNSKIGIERFLDEVDLDTFDINYANHPNLPISNSQISELRGRQPGLKTLQELADGKLATGIDAMPLPGNERSYATLLSELDRDIPGNARKPKGRNLVTDAGVAFERKNKVDGLGRKLGKPFKLKPGQTTRDVYGKGAKRVGALGGGQGADRSMLYGMLDHMLPSAESTKISRIPRGQRGYINKNMIKGLGKGALKGGGLLALYAAPEIFANVIAPTANQTARDKVGGMFDTDNWFDGRKGVNESILRFAGDMMLDPLYTFGGIALEDLARNRARGKRQAATSMRGRFGNKGTGLIASP